MEGRPEARVLLENGRGGWKVLEGTALVALEGGQIVLEPASREPLLRVHPVSFGRPPSFLAVETTTGLLYGLEFTNVHTALSCRLFAEAAIAKAFDAHPFASRTSALARGPQHTVRIERATADINVLYSSYGVLSGEAVPAPLWCIWLEILCKELAWYSKALWDAARISHVVLCTNLTYDGHKRQAVPHLINRILYIDANAATHRRAYLARVVHHEIFHFLDVGDGVLAAAGHGGVDEEWLACNTTEHAYDSGGGAAAQTAQSLQAEEEFTKSPQRGFVSFYAMSAPEEDRAETFAALVVDGPRLFDRVVETNDDQLTRKIKCIILRVARVDASRPATFHWRQPLDRPPFQCTFEEEQPSSFKPSKRSRMFCC